MNTILQHHGILGMKWGVRRYQNKDGSLTEIGQKRYSSEIAKNKLKSKKNRINEEDLKNPENWVKQDMERTKSAAESTNRLTSELSRINEKHIRSKSNAPLDLSKKSDAELRDAINRANLERQYNDIFNQPQVSRGRQIARSVLDTGGDILAVTAAGLGVALAIRELRGK